MSEQFKQLKGKLTLNLNNAVPTSTQQSTTLDSKLMGVSLLNALRSPSDMLDQLTQLATPTPSKVLCQDPTDAQKQYAQGFIDALRSIQQLNNFEPQTIVSPGFISPLISSPMLSPSQDQIIREFSIRNAIRNATTQSASSSSSSASSAGSLNATTTSIVPSSIPNAMVSSTAGLSLSTGVPMVQTQAMNTLPLPTEMLKHLGMPTTTIPQVSPQPSLCLPSSSVDRQDQARAPSEESDYSGTSSNSRSRSTTRTRFGTGPFDESQMDDNERKKLERKRLRNRQAATKCRQKKLDRINELELEVKQQKEVGLQMDRDLALLKQAYEQACHLVQIHSNSQCPLPPSI